MADILNIVAVAVGAIIVTFIFTEIYQTYTWNTAATNCGGVACFSGGGASLLGLVSMLVPAVIIILVVMYGFSRK